MLSRRDFLGGVASSALYSLRPGNCISALMRPEERVPPRLTEIAVSNLRKAVNGEIICPGDPTYETARLVASFNPTTDRRPQIIARCASDTDISQAVLFAREHSLEVAVRAGGFDVLGASVCDGGMVIDLSPLNAINVDEQNRTAQVQAGVRSHQLSSAAEPKGLAAALGCHPAIGITGLTLGGGLGWLAGKYGASCDNLVSANLITADGRQLRASASENRSLFWAIKGGGGNFGIVSSLTLQLHPVDQVFGGVAAYRGDVAAFLRFYRDFMRDAPGELMVELNIRSLKVPTILATACWSGNPAEGERRLRPLRQFGPPIADAIKTVAYSHLIDRPGPDFGRRLFGDNSPPPPSPTGESGPWHDYWRGGMLQELSDAAAAQIASLLLSAPSGWSIGLGHYIHGQLTRVTDSESPLPRKQGCLTYFFDVGWRNPSATETAMNWVNDSHAAMKRYSNPGTYINYLSSNSVTDVRASYGQNYEKLAALKHEYDPQNFFHLNRNIRPV